MTAFKKTILGKILGGAAKVILPIAGAVTGIGAITGMAKGIGAIAGVKNLVGGAVKGIDVVATKAADLVTGMTEEQRKILAEQKDKAADAKDKLDFAAKLMKAGMSQADAYAKAGISESDVTGTTNYKPIAIIGGGLALLALFLFNKKK